MRRFSNFAAAVLLSLVGTACASTSTISSTSTPASDAPRRTSVISREVITIDEIIKATDSPSAFELVQRLRPEYLRSRGVVSMRATGSSEPVVYVNDMRLGSLRELRSISSRDIWEVRYLRAADATTRLGTGHMAGAIMITLR